MTEKALGKRLQEARVKAGLTQQDMCHRAGLSYSTLAKIERGAIKAPSIFTIISIAEVLGLSLDELVGVQYAKNGSTASKKRSKSGITFVYFDINGCVVRFFHRAFTDIATSSGKPADMVETAFWHYNDAVCRGEISIEEFNRILGEKFGLPNFEWRNYYLKAVEPITEMHELLRWAEEHYNIGLVSNIMPGLIKMMMEKNLIPSLSYKAIVDSSEVQAIKPEAKLYEIAQSKAGCPAEEILLVDDARANLMAAERHGWHVLWFDDYRPDESAARIRQALEF